MKKIIFVLLILVLAFGCAEIGQKADTAPEQTQEPTISVEETDVEEMKAPVEEKSPDKKMEEQIAQEKEEPTKGVVTTKKPVESAPETELAALLAKIDEKVQSYKYIFGEPPRITESNTYLVQLKNDFGEDDFLIRVNLYEYEPTKLQDYWDTVFLNPAKQEATIYCLDRTLCQSKAIDKTKEKEAVPYDKYKRKAPHEWAKEIPANAKLVGPELIEGRTVTRFEYTGTDGIPYNVWLDDTYGIPLQVVSVAPDGTESDYLFREMTYNMQKNEEFQQPF